MSLDIKKNDTVKVISGDERGKKGRVLSIYPKEYKLLVEKLNIIKRHMKPSKKYTQGGIIEKESPICRSRVILLCPKCDKPTMIGCRVLDDGTKMRVCKNCKEIIDR
ncbi:MAG: 50S ribosomal protein L24 [Nitrospirae bacterium]|nr:50S ribosomal protein L24 [Nitrospirota bacterium]